MSPHYKRKIGDTALILLSFVPACVAFITDVNGITNDLFLRCGAIMVMFGAFLEFRTHEVQALREKDSIHAIWRTIGVLLEGMEKTDGAVKYILREMANLIQSAGIESAMGKPEEIKNMVLTERLKSLKFIKDTPEKYYKYNKLISIIGKVFVVLGTSIWAFGDIVVYWVVA